MRPKRRGQNLYRVRIVMIDPFLINCVLSFNSGMHYFEIFFDKGNNAGFHRTFIGLEREMKFTASLQGEYHRLCSMSHYFIDARIS